MPSAWTVLDPSTMNVQLEAGRRTYRSAEVPLDASDVIQISRDPRGNLRGTSALASYASLAWGMIAAAELPLAIITGPVLAPAAAELAGALRLANRAWILGADVFASTAEASAGDPPAELLTSSSRAFTAPTCCSWMCSSSTPARSRRRSASQLPCSTCRSRVA
jgi:hypothetical protein